MKTLTIEQAGNLTPAKIANEFASRHVSMTKLFNEQGKLVYALKNKKLKEGEGIYSILRKKGVTDGSISNASTASDVIESLVISEHISEIQFNGLTFKACRLIKKLQNGKGKVTLEAEEIAVHIKTAKDSRALSAELECLAENGITISEKEDADKAQAKAQEEQAKAQAKALESAKNAPIPSLHKDSPQEPTSAPQEPTSAPQEPTPAPQEPTPAPQEPTPAPQEPTPAPQEPTPAPQEPTPAPQEQTPAPQEQKTVKAITLENVLEGLDRVTLAALKLDADELEKVIQSMQDKHQQLQEVVEVAEVKVA